MADFDSPRTKLQATLRDYLQIFFRRKLFFFIPVCIIFLLVTTASFYLPPVYKASATIMVQEPRVINPLEQITNRGSQPKPQEQMLMIQEQMLSWPNLWSLIRYLKLGEEVTSRIEQEELLTELREQFALSMRANNVFDLSFEDKNPVKAQKAVNTLIQTFIETSLSTEREEAVTAVDFIGEQLERYRKKLEESDRALYEFKEKHLMTFPGMQENANLQKLIEYESQLVEVNLAYEESNRELDLLKKQLSGEERVLLTDTSRGLNPLVDELNTQIVAAELELTALLIDATEEHPRVVQLRGQIDSMKERLSQAIEETVNSETSSTNPVYQRLEQRYRELEIHIRNLTARKEGLEKLTAEFQKRVDNVPAAEKELARLTRDNMVSQNIYAMLLERLESNRISQIEVKERGAEYKVISPARLPLRPFKPQKSLMAILSLIIGSLFGMGIIFLTEFSDHSLHGMEDAKSFLNLPILAAVPLIMTPATLAIRKNEHRFTILLITGFLIAFFISLITGLILMSA